MPTCESTFQVWKQGKPWCIDCSHSSRKALVFHSMTKFWQEWHCWIDRRRTICMDWSCLTDCFGKPMWSIRIFPGAPIRKRVVLPWPAFKMQIWKLSRLPVELFRNHLPCPSSFNSMPTMPWVHNIWAWLLKKMGPSRPSSVTLMDSCWVGDDKPYGLVVIYGENKKIWCVGVLIIFKLFWTVERQRIPGRSGGWKLEVLESEALKGLFHPEIPEYGFWDPKSYSIIRIYKTNIVQSYAL